MQELRPVKLGGQFCPDCRQNAAHAPTCGYVEQHEPGAKLDQGKPRPSLILASMPRALRAVIEIGEYGAKKYTPRGWEKVPDGVARYTDAMYRHQLVENIEEVDQESKLFHMAHAAWNALARLELFLREKENGKK